MDDLRFRPSSCGAANATTETGIFKMSTTPVASVQRIKAALNHPVLDADGHTIEVTPVLIDFIKEVGGASACESYARWAPGPSNPTHEERRDGWSIPYHWTWPAKNTLDRATAALTAVVLRPDGRAGS